MKKGKKSLQIFPAPTWLKHWPFRKLLPPHSTSVWCPPCRSDSTSIMGVHLRQKGVQNTCMWSPCGEVCPAKESSCPHRIFVDVTCLHNSQGHSEAHTPSLPIATDFLLEGGWGLGEGLHGSIVSGCQPSASVPVLSKFVLLVISPADVLKLILGRQMQQQSCAVRPSKLFEQKPKFCQLIPAYTHWKHDILEQEHWLHPHLFTCFDASKTARRQKGWQKGI